MKLYVGIDPGSNGAIVFVDEDGDYYDGCVVPKIGNEYDVRAMYEILQKYKNDIAHIFIEDVHAFQKAGATGSFSFGRSKGLWEGLICGCELSYSMIQPKAWQAEAWQGVTKQYKAGTKKKTVDTKATSLIAFKRLFPDIDVRKSPKSSKQHDGLVDAALMAEVCRRKYKIK